MEVLEAVGCIFIASMAVTGICVLGERFMLWLLKRKYKSHIIESYCWEHPEDCDCRSCEDWEWCHPPDLYT